MPDERACIKREGGVMLFVILENFDPLARHD